MIAVEACHLDVCEDHSFLSIRGAGERDTELRAHGAPATVGADEVPGADTLCRSRPRDRGRDRVRPLLEALESGGELDLERPEDLTRGLLEDELVVMLTRYLRRKLP